MDEYRPFRVEAKKEGLHLMQKNGLRAWRFTGSSPVPRKRDGEEGSQVQEDQDQENQQDQEGEVDEAICRQLENIRQSQILTLLDGFNKPQCLPERQYGWAQQVQEVAVMH